MRPGPQSRVLRGREALVSCALRFFFGVTLGRKDAAVRIVSAKEPKKLPVVLSAGEIARFLSRRSRACATGRH